MSLISASNSSLVEFLVERDIAIPYLNVVDVGVSGGLSPVWRKWGNRLSALGIDVIVDEIERLTNDETNPAVRYVAARVASPVVEGPAKCPRSNYALHRSQAYLATAALRRPQEGKREADFVQLWRETVDCELAPAPFEANYANIADPMADPFFAYYARRFARKEKPRVTDRTSTVDELVFEAGTMQHVDILKIDTDGWDFDALRGAERVLASGCLAVEIETQFHGPLSETSNVFCNIDSFLRAHGFTLFKLAPVNYSRSALPRRFVYDVPAQTEGGQIVWADALYVRDLANKRHTGEPAGSVDRDKMRNLALILDLYGMEDAAAELLLAVPGVFDGVDDRPSLDFLTRKIHGPNVTFLQVVEAFLADPIEFHKRLGNDRSG